MGDASTGSYRQITNVAQATQAHDAVNLQQMQAGDAATLASANAFTNTQIASVNHNIDALTASVDQRFSAQGRQIDRVGALGAAMAGMTASAAAVQGSNTRFGAAFGTYQGQSAFSIGFQHQFNSHVAVTLGGSFSGAEHTATIGIGYGL